MFKTFADKLIAIFSIFVVILNSYILKKIDYNRIRGCMLMNNFINWKVTKKKNQQHIFCLKSSCGSFQQSLLPIIFHVPKSLKIPLLQNMNGQIKTICLWFEISIFQGHQVFTSVVRVLLLKIKIDSYKIYSVSIRMLVFLQLVKALPLFAIQTLMSSSALVYPFR